MQLEVRLFGPVARRLGRDAVSIACADRATLADVRAAIAASQPDLAEFLAVGRLALNHRYVAEDAAVKTGDELALIAMVSGG